jgi:deazaflavin-dependent oxidoreductase (nitroreductase family)
VSADGAGLADRLDVRTAHRHPLARAVRWMASTGLAARLLARLMPRLDPVLLRCTGGRHTLTELLAGLPVVALTTTGARTGLPRRSLVVAVRVDADLALIGSNFGGRRHPGWVHNLLADPSATLTRRGRTVPVLARCADGALADRIWRAARAQYRGFAVYPRRTGGRPVHVFLLRGVPAPSGPADGGPLSPS